MTMTMLSRTATHPVMTMTLLSNTATRLVMTMAMFSNTATRLVMTMPILSRTATRLGMTMTMLSRTATRLVMTMTMLSRTATRLVLTMTMLSRIAYTKMTMTVVEKLLKWKNYVWKGIQIYLCHNSGLIKKVPSRLVYFIKYFPDFYSLELSRIFPGTITTFLHINPW